MSFVARASWLIPFAVTLGTSMLEVRAQNDKSKPIADKQRMPVNPSVPEERPWSLRPVDDDSRHARDRTQAKLGTSRASLATLRRDMVMTAGMELRARFKLYVSGSRESTLDILIDTSLRLLAAESALSSTQAERVAALERYWLLCREIEELNRRRFEAGRIGIQDLAFSQYYRVDAEIRLVKAGGVRQAKKQPPVLTEAVSWFEHSRVVAETPAVMVLGDRRGNRPSPIQEAVGYETGPYWLRDVAKARYELSRASLSDLLRARVNAALTQCEGRYRLYLAGSRESTLDILLESIALVAQAEAELNDTEEARLAALEITWRTALEAEKINRARFDSGRLAIQDIAYSTCERVGAEMRLVEAIKRRPKGAPLQSVLSTALGRVLRKETVLLDEVQEPVPDSDFPRRRAALRDADLGKLAMERLAAARTVHEARFKLYEAGSRESTLYLLILSSLRLVDAALEVCRTDTERLAAFEKHWERAWELDQINKARYDAGSIAIHDQLQSRYQRLDAELRWAEARSRIQDKTKK